MSDTVGFLIDKLFTIDTKMFVNQDLFYEIRRMTFDSFKEKYVSDNKGTKRLWAILQKCADLNIQRNNLINEIDEKLIEMILEAKKGNDLHEKFSQKSHKTY